MTIGHRNDHESIKLETMTIELDKTILEKFKKELTEYTNKEIERFSKETKKNTIWISVKDIAPPKDIPFIGYCLAGFVKKKEIHFFIWDEFYKRYVDAEYGDRDYHMEVTHWLAPPKFPEI